MRIHLRAEGKNGPKDWIGEVRGDTVFIQFGSVGKTLQTRQIAETSWTKGTAEAELQHRAQKQRAEGYEDVDNDPPAQAGSEMFIFSAKVKRNTDGEQSLRKVVEVLPDLPALGKLVEDATSLTLAGRAAKDTPLFRQWVLCLLAVVEANATVMACNETSKDFLEITDAYDAMTLSAEEVELTYKLGIRVRPVDLSQAQSEWMTGMALV